jgi:DsbC/DsbD-like thiol-disulfide interchange protein
MNLKSFVALSIVTGALLSGAVATARGENAVITEIKTYVSRDMVRAGETFQAALRLVIGPGWHVNANPVNDDFLIPTTVEIGGEGRFKALDTVYPEPVLARLPFSEADVALYSESALIGVLLRADDGLAPGNYVLKGTVTWQACNDVSCLPPETRGVEIEIVVAEPGQATNAVNTDVFEKIGFAPRPRA